MKKENVVVKKNTSEHLAPSGRGRHAVPGEGVLNKEHFMGTPSSPLRGTSPARGEVNGGFTLIELLVVVLIIGILAAVALPQYQLAVDKARFSKLLSMTNAVKKAQEVYYEANGDYTTNWEELDVNFPGTIEGNKLSSPEGWKMTLSHTNLGTGAVNAVYVTDNLLPDVILYHRYRFPVNIYANKIHCYADVRNKRAIKLCQAVSGKKTRDVGSGDYNNVYSIN